ncbi:MAG: hypothetical protein K2G52_05910 [Muribaculaceae bacterium]|nr:hypothetical protein [Muribaculaceae bacterium]
MDDLTKTRIEADNAEIKAHKDSYILKILGYLLALVIGGAIVCLIMGILKTAVDSLVIVGTILLVVALFILWVYNSAKAHVIEKRYKGVLRKYESGDKS